MPMNRRHFLGTVGAGVAVLPLPLLLNRSIAEAAAPASPGAAGIGMCDWNLGEMSDPEEIPRAREAGLDGIQVSLGTDPGNVPLRSESVRKRYLELGREHGIAFNSIALGMMNGIPLATEPQAAVWVVDAIEAAAALGATNVLLAFFGRGDLRLRDELGNRRRHEEGGFASFELNKKHVTRVVEALLQIVPRAERAGVILGLENTITAKQNLEIIEATGSPMVQVYYDVGNSTWNGYDVPGELRMLGKDRICEVHLKDRNTPMLGSPEGTVDMPAIAQALRDIGYDRWLVLETSGRKGRFMEDTRANVAFVKRTFDVA